jgi:hypothetical protein
MNKPPGKFCRVVYFGGDDRSRTCDILLAKQALYQLSYIPELIIALVGLAGLEPATSSLSVTRSNQLSYKPAEGLIWGQLTSVFKHIISI